MLRHVQRKTARNTNAEDIDHSALFGLFENICLTRREEHLYAPACAKKNGSRYKRRGYRSLGSLGFI